MHRHQHQQLQLHAPEHQTQRRELTKKTQKPIHQNPTKTNQHWKKAQIHQTLFLLEGPGSIKESIKFPGNPENKEKPTRSNARR